ncbi:TPA: anthrax toxin-like adenylyl cyclase domain-containing protein [Providencia alcalifaciens]
MPKPNIELHFSQSDFVKHSNQYDKKGGLFSVNNAKTSDLKKMVTWNGIDYSLSDGYCYGFSSAFLSYSSIGKGDDYLNAMKSLIDIANDESVYENKYDKIRIKALKKHAGILLNEHMQDVIFSHRLEVNLSTIYSNSFYKYTSGIRGRSFIDYMNDSIMEGADSYKKYKEKNGNKIKHKYVDYLSDLQKIKLKEFLSSLNHEFDYFEKTNGQLFRDPWFGAFHKAFYSRKDTLGENFTIKDANFAKEMILKSIAYDEYHYQKEVNKINGIDLNLKLHSYNGRLSYRNEINLNEFIDKISNHTRSSKEIQLFEFKAPAHSMALSVNYNEKTKSWDYAFFDPNYGVLKYYNENDFNKFLTDFVEKHADYYGFPKDKDGGYVVAFSEFQVSKNRRIPLNELNLENVRITENILLADDKTTVYLNENRKNKITYQSFNVENNIAKVELKIEGVKKTIYTDILNVAELASLINENIKSVSNVSGDIFISHHDNKVYAVDGEFDIDSMRGISKGIDYDDVNLHIKPISKNNREILTGIPELHQQAIMQVANEENIIIGIRPIDEKSTSLILSGEYSSKGLNIKSKSADWGPHCGFIPMQQEYAKRTGRENKNKYNLYTQQAIDDGHAKSTILELTPERVNELTVYNEITPLEKVNGSEYSKTTSLLDGKEKIFLLKKINRDGKYFWHVFHEDEGNIKPFHVIADPLTGKALTADYDLFTVIFPFSDLEHYVKVIEMPNWSEWKSSVIYDELTLEQKKLYNNEAEYNKKEGRDNGITNKRIKEINKKLNNKIGRPDGFELIHHGADDANPASVMNDNFPITFFLPEKIKGKNKLSGSPEPIDTYFKMNAQGAIIINDVEQLSNLQQLLINQGYRAPLNKKWSEGDLAQYFDKKRKISATHIEKTAEVQRKMSIPPDTVSGQEINIEKILGKPVIQLDSGFDDVYLNYEKQHIMEVAAGEHSPNTNAIDHWPDPMAHYWDVKSRDAETNRRIKPTEYDYNVIIQLENDAVIKRVVANAFSKHPDDSMVIQYDIQTKQWKVLHGDLDRVKQGKIRYITAGHGDYQGHNQSTLYAGYTANQYADGINHLRKKLLNNKTPDKLVLIGCNLGRGGASENFAFKATNALAEHGMYMPITAYNRPLMNMYLGNKLIVPDPAIRESVSTKGHKFIYQYLPDAQQIRINKNSSILYFINEFRRGELKLNQLNSYSEPDVFAAFRHPETRSLNFDLLKTVAYNPEVYQLFVSELKHHNGVLPERFYHDFSQKVDRLHMPSVPIWKMVDARHILHYSLSHSTPNDASLTVIVRVVNDPKGLVQAEKLAARNPKNTLIFQMDADAKNWVLEYGSAELSSLLESQKKTQWVIIGDAATVRKSTDDLASMLLSVKHTYPFTTPEQILFHSTSPAMITDSGEQQLFTSNLSTKLKQLGIDASVSSKFTPTGSSRPIHPVIPMTDVSLITDKGLARKIGHSQIQSLFEKIALKEINIDDIRLVEHPYLADYFTNENGQLDKQKVKNVVYDPLFNIEFNRYLNGTENSATNASELFSLSLPKGYAQQADHIHTLLSGIKDDLFVLNHLSPRSKALLQTLFPSGDGIDNGKILDIVTDNNKFSLLSEKLVRFSQLGAHNFEGETAALKNLTFEDAFNLYDAGYTQRLQQFNRLMNQQNTGDVGYQVGLVNHGGVRSNHSSHARDQALGLVYGIEYALSDVHVARDLIERQAQLEEANLKNRLSPVEEKWLMEIKKYNQTLNEVISRKGISVADQSVSNLFSSQSDIKNSITFLKGTQAVYTVINRERNGVYEYCLFDPQGIQFSVKHENRQLARQQFQQHVEGYFAENIQLADGQQISRGKAAGFSVMNNGDFRGDIQSIDLDATHVKAILFNSLNERSLILQNKAFITPKNCWVEFGNERIAFAKLQNLGATINGQPLSMSDLSIDNLHKKIRFSPEKLASYFTLMEGNQDDLAFIKIFNEQIKSKDIYQLVDHEGSFAETAVLKKQLNYLANDVDLQQDVIPASTLKNLQQVGVKLPRYQRVANRFGQGMGAAGAIQCLISAQTILNRLDHPDVTDTEAKELEKQFYLLCASAFFNHGDKVLQPMLLNIASKSGPTSLLRARLASGTVVVFSLVGMGLDAYQAYDSLSKLDTVTDPKQRQDLIVNASFSIASFIVSGVVVVGILIGASTIPVVGLAIGGVLIVGGWIYSGVRAVENIKEVIDIDWDRELEEGIRGALGIEPTLRTQQEINAKRYIDAFKQQDWNMDLAQFEQQLLPAGFDQHFSIVEKPIQRSEVRFYLTDDHGNYFLGGLKYAKWKNIPKSLPYFSIKGALSFTEADVDFILENKSYKNTAWFRNLPYVYREHGLQVRKHFSIKKEVKAVNDYVKVGSEPTNEQYFLNPNYQNPLLERFKARLRIPDVYTRSSIKQQLMVSSPEQISLFSRKKKYGVSEPVVAQDVSKGEQFINDRDRIGWYLEDKNSSGTSWNTANGNDVIIGYAEQKNAFQVLSGEKYFAGGNHDDLFYIRDGNLDSLQARADNQPTKYLDGQAGVDTVIVDTLPKYHHVYANLAKNTLHYKKEGNNPFISVASLQNVENFIVKGNSNDSLRGNSEDNILDGGYGKDLLIGEAGNDKLILTQGSAIGGEGNDRYHVRRYKWFDAVDNFYVSDRYWDRKEKKVKTRRYLSPVYQTITKTYEANVVIEETSQSQSMISLEYSLDEIKRVFVDGKDLHLVIKLPSATVDGKTYDNIESVVTIVLKNAVGEYEGQKVIHHQYRVQTQDGFMLETRFEDNRPHQYFTLCYVESIDQTKRSERQVVKINEDLNTILVGENRHYISPDWGWFSHVGRADQLEYRGNAQNNMLPFLQAGSHIQVSRGVDTYQVVQTQPDDREITFDFSAVNSQFTEKDKIILVLPNENGYMLKMNGLKLQRVDKQGKAQLSIHFTQVGNELGDAVLIQDKYSNLFNVNLKTQTLSPLNPIPESTDSQDAIILPIGYQSPSAVINGKQGDDIIIDRSGYGHILTGGEGDDKLLALEGENVFISLEGEDNLTGGKGDDLYIVSAHGGADGHGDVIISDIEGHNQVVLIDFNPYSVSHHQISADMAETRYQSESGRRAIIRHSNLLKSEDNVMTFKHLTGYQSLAKVNVESTVDRLVQLLAEQRLADDSNFEPSVSNKDNHYKWGAVQATERFINQLT